MAGFITFDKNIFFRVVVSTLYWRGEFYSAQARPLDLHGNCPYFTTIGFCRHGITCRFGLPHISAEGYNITKEGTLVTYEKIRQGFGQHWEDNDLPGSLKVALRYYDLIIDIKLSNQAGICWYELTPVTHSQPEYTSHQ